MAGEFRSENIEGTAQAAEAVLERVLREKNRERASVVALYGDLGAGKTAFVQAAAGALGVRDAVKSPTFLIQRIYALPEKAHPFARLVHIDAYRLSGADDLRELGFDELARDPGNIIFVEWADNVESILSDDAVKVRFDFEEESRRNISIQAPNDKAQMSNQ